MAEVYTGFTYAVTQSSVAWPISSVQNTTPRPSIYRVSRIDKAGNENTKDQCTHYSDSHTIPVPLVAVTHFYKNSIPHANQQLSYTVHLSLNSPARNEEHPYRATHVRRSVHQARIYLGARTRVYTYNTSRMLNIFGEREYGTRFVTKIVICIC